MKGKRGQGEGGGRGKLNVGLAERALRWQKELTRPQAVWSSSVEATRDYFRSPKQMPRQETVQTESSGTPDQIPLSPHSSAWAPPGQPTPLTGLASKSPHDVTRLKG